MKKELLTILCMTLVCASVMLGIMGVYKMAGTEYKAKIADKQTVENSAFKVKSMKNLI